MRAKTNFEKLVVNDINGAQTAAAQFEIVSKKKRKSVFELKSATARVNRARVVHTEAVTRLVKTREFNTVLESQCGEYIRELEALEAEKRATEKKIAALYRTFEKTRRDSREVASQWRAVGDIVSSELRQLAGLSTAYPLQDGNATHTQSNENEKSFNTKFTGQLSPRASDEIGQSIVASMERVVPR